MRVLTTLACEWAPSRWRLALAFAMLVAASLVSPALAAEETGPGVERVRFFALGIEAGLAQPTVRAMAQDHDGFLWIGSQDGLSRYDGHEFEVFRRDTRSAAGLSDNHITALTVDGEGVLWIGTQSGGLSRRDPRDGSITRAVREFGKDDRVSFEQIEALLWDTRVGLLVASAGGLIQRQTGAGWEALELGIGRATGPVRSLRVSQQGDLLIAARNGAWRCRGLGECGAAFADADGRAIDAYDLLDDADHSVWLASTERGLFHYSATSELIERIHRGGEEGRRLGDDATRSLLIDRAGRLWVANNNGVSRLSPDRTQLRNWHPRPTSIGGLPTGRLHTLFEDRSGLLWFGTWTEGLALLDPATESFMSISSDSSQAGAIPSDVISALLAAADGSLWLGQGSTGGLVRFDLRRGVVERFLHDPKDPSSLSHNFVQHLAFDRKGRLWIATRGGGLNRMRADGRSFDRFIHQPDDPGSLANDQLVSLYADSENTLWISTLDSGLDRLCDGCTEFVHYRHDPADPHSISSDNINSVYEDSRGHFWVALRPGGINLLDRASGRFDGVQARPSDPTSLSSNAVTVLFEDSRHKLWVGTQGGGVNRVEGMVGGVPLFRRLSRADGLGSDAVGSMFEDARGQLWAGTTAGLSRIDPERWQSENFGSRDGTQTGGYFVGSQARLPNGSMAFGGLRGVTILDPEQLTARRPPGRVVLTRARSLAATDLDQDSLRLADRIRHDGSLRLRHPAQDVSFEFSALALNAPEGLRYRHRLDGLDTDWLYSEPRRRFAAYTNLPTGSYQFRVQATVGTLVGPETVIALTVDPSLAAHPLARIGYGVLGSLLLLGFVWQVRSRWRERERAADRLRDSEARLKLALWGTGDELWDLDLRNDSMKRINPLPFLAAPREENSMRAADLLRFIHPDDRNLPVLALTSHLRGETEVFEVTYRVLDTAGEWRWLRSRGRIVERDTNARALRVAGTVSDVTELKNGEISLQTLNRELEQRVEERTAALTRSNETLHGTVADLKLAQRQLVDSEKMAALGGLVAGVAHAINTPLGISVTAASHLQGETLRLRRQLESGELKRSDLDAYESTARESSELILRNLQRADKLVKSFKQVAVDQSSEARRHIVLALYIDEILTSLRPALKRARHRIIVDCPPDLGFVTLPGAIYQVLANLVMNTLVHAFAPDEPGEIRIEASLKATHVLLTYADNGCGMTEESRLRIFEPFYTTRRGQGGSGLGMHIVFNLVTQGLGGTIECDSAPGQGVYFSIQIPRDSTLA
ncbi:MAG: two-component regulator propeller domain-containing protein [Pseudomarimonas sp.]